MARNADVDKALRTERARKLLGRDTINVGDEDLPEDTMGF